MVKQTKALFLDRDGTINVDYGYVYQPEKFELIDGIIDVCLKAQKLGYLIIVITNQSGIERGYYTETDFKNMNQYMIDLFKKQGVHLTDVFYCPDLESPDRKPNPGMFLKAQKKYHIDMAQSVSIGDKDRDIEAGKKAGVGKNLLFNGHNFNEIKEVLVCKS